MLPCSLCGNHILVTHQDQRLFLFLSFPVNQKISVNVRHLQLLKDTGKQLLQNIVKALKLWNIVLPRIRDRLIPNHFGQFFRIPFLPLRVRLCHVRRFLSRHQKCVQDGNQKQCKDNQKQKADDFQYKHEYSHVFSPPILAPVRGSVSFFSMPDTQEEWSRHRTE